MKTLSKSFARTSGAMICLFLAGCASDGSRSGLPPTEATIKQKLIGSWFKPQAYVRGEKRPPAGDEIAYRPDGTCTYYITSGSISENQITSSERESWPGHWRLDGTKLYRTWKPNWHFFAGQGPGNGEIVTLTSEEMTLRNDRGLLEHYYSRPRWDEREPIMLDTERSVPWY